MSGLLGLDFETYGGVSLPDHGLARYMDDKTFTPLIAGVAWREGKVIQRRRFDLVQDFRSSREFLGDMMKGNLIVAHNAGFEMGVLDALSLSLPSSRFVDSAVIARAAGGGGHLEAAAPQLLDTGKLEMGKDLMKLFSIPGRYQEENGNLDFDPQVIADNPHEWAQYGIYCEVDASLGLQIAEEFLPWVSTKEMEYQAITMDMNRTGWCVDLASVEEMQRRYLENLEAAVFEFRLHNNATDLNLNSLKQLKAWCADRGVKFTSFDEKHVERYSKVIEKKLKTPMLDLTKARDYEQVAALLHTKKILGGSSLKKLKVILDTASTDFERPGQYRLKDQYLHCGAGQTLRTTGRSVQMQNLKQLTQPADMSELLDDVSLEWSNETLAANIRQVFTASDPKGWLIVGDFKSIESRGLAWMAGEDWKYQAYLAGEDVYSRLSERMLGIPYQQITAETRKPGKVGELSCGYGAGSDAVKDFAEKMHITLTEGEATKVVWDWRDACPRTVDFWHELDDMLHDVVENGVTRSIPLPDGLHLKMQQVTTPASLMRQYPGARSVMMSLICQNGVTMKRLFHGCYASGRNIRYFKPSERKTGDLWRNTFTDPKTKQIRFFELYGGKLAGILTQSFCRELFFESLLKVQKWTWAQGPQLRLVGQFHDEIVLDLKPGTLSLGNAEAELRSFMSHSEIAPSFPLAAEIKHDYRYTK